MHKGGRSTFTKKFIFLKMSQSILILHMKRVKKIGKIELYRYAPFLGLPSKASMSEVTEAALDVRDGCSVEICANIGPSCPLLFLAFSFFLLGFFKSDIISLNALNNKKKNDQTITNTWLLQVAFFESSKNWPTQYQRVFWAFSTQYLNITLRYAVTVIFLNR